jgi:predicted GIY-YIG superfamily endonuclease
MTILKSNMVTWSKELCQQEALKYETKRDFRIINRNAYEFAYRYGFLNEICIHMIPVGSKLKRCLYVYEFPDHSVYVGITSDFKRRKSDREKRQFDTVTKYINKTGLQPVHKQLTDYVEVTEAQRLEGECVNEYKDNNWQVLNVAKTGGIGGDILYWTYDKCMAEALKYSRRKDFNLHSKGAYDSCRRNNWLPDAHKHMQPYLSKPYNYWTKDNCIKEALKYTTRKEFKDNSSGAYGRGCKQKWLDELCQHMIKH